MKNILIPLIAAAAIFAADPAVYGQSLWDMDHLASVRSSVNSTPNNDGSAVATSSNDISRTRFYGDAYSRLLKQADSIMTLEPLSVMMKENAPASGDKHDYASLARYFWPDKDKPDGLPYVQRDGYTNPEVELYDRNKLETTADRILLLTIAGYLSGDSRYSDRAVLLINTWFLNPETRMNPHLKYSQFVPGRDEGRGRKYGLIDTYKLIRVADAARMLESSGFLPDADAASLKEWYRSLASWMKTSGMGMEESKATNNHSVAYDAQLIAFSLYGGDEATVAEVLGSFPAKRVWTQIRPDGSQPRELQRTLAFGYSEFNLCHMIDVFMLGHSLGYELETMSSDEGVDFYAGMDFLLPYLGKTVGEWPYKQVSDWDFKQQEFCRDLYRAATMLHHDRPDYLDAFHRFYKDEDPLFKLMYMRDRE